MNKNLLFIGLFLSLLYSCNSDDDFTLCLEPPSGMIEADKTNLTVFFQEGLWSFQNITLIDADGNEFDLDVSSFGQQPFSDWQVIPDLNYNIVILETITDRLYEFENLVFADDKQLALVITRSNDGGYEVNIEQYLPCDDTPSP